MLSEILEKEEEIRDQKNKAGEADSPENPYPNLASTLGTQETEKHLLKDKPEGSPSPPRPTKELKNGPQRFKPVTIENSSNSLYYHRKELCRSICGLPLW